MRKFSQPVDQPRADYGLPSRHRHLSVAFNPPNTVSPVQLRIDQQMAQKPSLYRAHPTAILPLSDQGPLSGNRQKEKQTRTQKPATLTPAFSSQQRSTPPSEKPSRKRKRALSEDTTVDLPTQEITKGPPTPPSSPTPTPMLYQSEDIKEATGGSCAAEAARVRYPSPPLDHERDVVFEEVVQEGDATPATVESGTPEEMEWDRF